MIGIADDVRNPHARVMGVGGYRPERVVTNDEVCEHLDSSDEWIRTRSGIVTRHWANEEETLAEMAYAASVKALAQAGLVPDDLGCVVVSTFTHLQQTPSAATAIADRLGITAAAFDLSAGCAGFAYGLAVAKGMVVAGIAEYVLVVGAERMTDLLDQEDRSTAFLFGDGAGAVVVGPSDEPGIGPIVWGSDGGNGALIRQTVPWDTLRTQPDVRWPALTQDGTKVFRWAVTEVVEVAREAVTRAGITVDELDAFVPHQANERIIDSMARSLALPGRVAIARDVTTTGNTSGASIPLAVEQLLSSGAAASGGTALIAGYGAGLCYAAVVLQLP